MQILLIPYMRISVNEYEKKLIIEIKTEFKEMLELFRSALAAGFSVKNSVFHCRKEMELLGYKNGFIVKELDYIIRQIKLNIPVDELFVDWGVRSRIDDIQNFASVFQIAHKMGANLAKIMKDSSRIIGERIEIDRQIETILSARQYERKIMNSIPIAIIIYMRLTSPSFMVPLYNTTMGVLVMTCSLFIYFIAIVISTKIMDIEV